MNLKEKLNQVPLVKTWKRIQLKKQFRGSLQYWEDRYQSKGNSGTGSYTHLAEFKAEILNNFVTTNNINRVIEFGCGDGNQLTRAKYPEYIGLDVSPTAIKICADLFRDDHAKSFYLYDTLAFQDNCRLFQADLVLSLDVLFHLVEQEIFETYIRHLFDASTKYVIIYASDFNQNDDAVYQHDKRRNFTTYVEKNIPGWKLKEVVYNKYPVEKYKEKGSLSDFYIYEKAEGR